MPDEIKLIRLCKKGKKKAQKNIFEQYYNYVFVICLRYLKNKLDAEDLSQDVFYNLFKNINKFDEKKHKSLKPWIQTIAVNTSLNYIKKKRAELFENQDEEYNYQTISTINDTEPEFTNQELRKAIDELSEGKRIIFNLFAIDGYKHNEIAEKLGITSGTSRSQYKKAKETLKIILTKMSEDF